MNTDTPPTDQTKLRIGSETIEPGTKTKIPITVTRALNGADVRLWVHVIRGDKPGPTVAMLSTLHGAEWFSVTALKRLIEATDPNELSGTIIAVPVANPPALRQQTRNMPDEADSPDLNRIFPGPLTWMSDQLAATISTEVLAHASLLMDFHMGPWGSTFRDILVGADFPKDGVSDESERLAIAFGSPMIRRANLVTGFPGPKSALGYAGGILDIPALGVEVGGVGFGAALEADWTSATVDGINAVLGALDMIADPPDPRPARQMIYERGHRVNPSIGGYLRSNFGGDQLGTEVQAGDLLGGVYSPYTFELLEELRAPADGLLFYCARSYPVDPGDWAFGVAETEGARWIENPDNAKDHS